MNQEIKWIDITEQYPEEGELVLAGACYKVRVYKCYSEGTFDPKGKNTLHLYPVCDCTCEGKYCYYDDLVITHWTPLPMPN